MSFSNVYRASSRAGLANTHPLNLCSRTLISYQNARWLSVTRSVKEAEKASDVKLKTPEKAHSFAKAADEKKEYETPAVPFDAAEINGLDLNSIFLLSIPITTRRSFIYCHHHTGLLQKDQLDGVPWLAKSEEKLVGLARKAWDKLVTSDLSINKKIVSLVSRLLNSIPYDENCLRSFPSKEAMVRETNANQPLDLPRAMLTAEVNAKNIDVQQLKPVPVFHPKTQDPKMILDQMHQFRTDLVSHHRKWAILCAIGIPISLPVALIPVAPNVPGFYLAYRLYCHLQALRGAKNLGFLLESSTPKTSEKPDSQTSYEHLTFKHHESLDSLFSSADILDAAHERMVLESDTVDKIVQSTGLVEIKEDLYRAFKQESSRLEQAKKSESE